MESTRKCCNYAAHFEIIADDEKATHCVKPGHPTKMLKGGMKKVCGPRKLKFLKISFVPHKRWCSQRKRHNLI